MLYNSLKIFHIISAAVLLVSMGISIQFWFNQNNSETISQRVQTLTMLVFIPCALLQLATGFTMISVNHYHFSQLWIMGSVSGFIILICSWFAFVYFLLSSRKQLSLIMLIVSLLALLSMIFFMANKII